MCPLPQEWACVCCSLNPDTRSPEIPPQSSLITTCETAWWCHSVRRHSSLHSRGWAWVPWCRHKYHGSPSISSLILRSLQRPPCCSCVFVWKLRSEGGPSPAYHRLRPSVRPRPDSGLSGSTMRIGTSPDLVNAGELTQSHVLNYEGSLILLQPESAYKVSLVPVTFFFYLTKQSSLKLKYNV